MTEHQQPPNRQPEGEEQLQSAPTSIRDLVTKAKEVRDLILVALATIVAFVTGADQIVDEVNLITQQASIPILIVCGVIMIGVGGYYIFYKEHHRLLGGLIIYSTLVTGIAFWLMIQYFSSPMSIKGTVEAIINDVVDNSFPLISCVSLYKIENGKYLWTNGRALDENTFEFAGLDSGTYELRIGSGRHRITIPTGIKRLLNLFVIPVAPIPVEISQGVQQNTTDTSASFFSDNPQQNVKNQQLTSNLNCRGNS